MMVGSILWNCWAALIGFSIYFFTTFQSFKTPTTILFNSFIIAFVVFLIAFLVRFIIGFVFFLPQSEESILSEGEIIVNNEQTKEQQASQMNNITEENAEEVAKVVQSMMLEDIK